MDRKASKPVLVVEDEQNDIFLLQYAFECAGISEPLISVEDGQQAIDYLSGKGKFAERKEFPLPCLMLLDLKLPRVMGLDVLRWIRGRPELQMLPVVVLTSSSEASDIKQAYTLGARSYLVKPVSVQQRLELVEALKTYWLELNQLPSEVYPAIARRA
jgi:CheY-like chemotaxis protein